MKKTYISPKMRVKHIVLGQIMQGSITGVGGDTEITPADPTDPIPGEADAKDNNNFNVWED